jgi:hypothetical protein
MSVAFLYEAMAIAAVLVMFCAAVGSIRYRVTGDAVEVLLLGRRVRRIAFDDIEEVSRRGAIIHESWSGPRFWNAVTLRRRRGLLRNVIITPDDPDRFVERLERILAERAACGATGSSAQP